MEAEANIKKRCERGEKMINIACSFRTNHSNLVQHVALPTRPLEPIYYISEGAHVNPLHLLLQSCLVQWLPMV
jgi:hypothetical protein